MYSVPLKIFEKRIVVKSFIKNMTSSSDSKFITNEGEKNLLERFKVLIKHTEFFDVLVGYFRTSGFYNLQESLESVSKIRILVGLNVDQKTYELIENTDTQGLNFSSSKEIKLKLRKQTKGEMENSDDSLNTEIGIDKFEEFLKTGRIEFRAYPKANIHAKVYISRLQKSHIDYGRVITGSSNFSKSGLVDNLEFNVELKDRPDVEFALEKFEELWEESIDITEDYVETIRTETWLNNSITPYEIYLKLLYEYFKEDIDLDEVKEEVFLPESFKELKYQLQAVTSAKKILDAYNGVFLADVVGLGKTFISALLAQKLIGKILVICPPVLKDYWHETFRDFGVRGFDVESQGKLDHIIKKGTQYDYIFVDEAHRFRNEGTQGYEKLHQICFGKKVILVSATPLNNTINDIYSQLKLFQIPRKSTIPGIPNLEDYFSSLRRRLSSYKKTDPEYTGVVKETSKDVRDRLLRHVMVRRTRAEIQEYFHEDLQLQKLSFPEIGDPRRIIYAFDSVTHDVFYETIRLLKLFKYSRYTPLLYLKEGPSELVKQSQLNVGGFMKAILVKRLESSFYAFMKTVKRFINSYEKFIEMYEGGTVYISKSVDVYDYLDKDNEEELLGLVDDQDLRKVQKYSSGSFKKELSIHLGFDLELLKRIKYLWRGVEEDPKLNQFIYELKNEAVLKRNKSIIFTESKETGDYLYENLNRVFPNEVMFYSSHGGRYKTTETNVTDSRDLIKENFDPNNKITKDDLRLLITTDVLAEGINLHRANTVINYDLPWNPTKVMQRVGRINRLGTEHLSLYVYNFFPTSESDEHLGLEANIKSKIQAFHETLGEDAKYITEEEEPVTHELFGDRLYEILSDKRSYEGEDEDESDLKYLKILRDIRDNKTPLFKKIERLPGKVRSARHCSGDSDKLITFFRKGKLKKFLVTEGRDSRELNFFEAVNYFKCDQETPRARIPLEFYYQFLGVNKAEFNSLTSGEPAMRVQFRSNSNESYLLKRLKAREIRMSESLTDDEKEFLGKTIVAFEYGIVPKGTSRKLRRLIEMELESAKVISILRNTIPNSILKFNPLGYTHGEKSQIVLSQYLYTGN